MTAAPDVSIVVVTARRPERLLRCLAAVARSVPAGLAYEVVLVLNAPEDGFAARIEGAVGDAVVLHSAVPLGLPGGANLGASAARGRLLHLLHDDAEVEPGWLEPLMATLAREPRAGAVGSVLLDPAGGLQAAGQVLWADATTSAPWSGEPPAAGGLGTAAYPVDYANSASLLIDRAAWDAAGGADEGFHPAYYVDVDLAMALRAHGYVVLCEPASRVRHERGGSSGAAFQQFLTDRHRERFARKWRADLVHQAEGPIHAQGALERARRATEARAAAVAAGPLRPAASAPPAPPDERAALLRDLAVKDAFAVHAQRLLDEATATRERLEADGAVAQRVLADIHARHDAAHRDLAAVAAAHAALEREHAALRREHEALKRAHDARSGGLRARVRKAIRRRS